MGRENNGIGRAFARRWAMHTKIMKLIQLLNLGSFPERPG
jgi:hypothetical protein